MTIVEGFDSRGWDGILSPEYQAIMKYCGIKISQGQRWIPPEGYTTLPRQWRRAKKNYNLLRLPFHYLLSPPFYTEPVQYGKAQAKNFHQSIIDHFDNDFGEIPPAIDVENRFTGMASGYNRVKCLRACLDKTADLWNEVPGIYTATWYWDTYIHPYVGDWKYWEEHWLWEADPPPDTIIKGWVDGGDIIQVALDKLVNGFNTKVDFNETTKIWLDSVTQVVPIPDDCDNEIAAALAEQKSQLEGEHLIEMALVKHDAYNLAIFEAKNAVKKLAKE